MLRSGGTVRFSGVRRFIAAFRGEAVPPTNAITPPQSDDKSPHSKTGNFGVLMTNSQSTSRPAANRVSDAPSILPTDPALLAVAAKLLQQAAQVEDIGSLLPAGFPHVAAAVGADYVALVAPSGGRWSVVGEWRTDWSAGILPAKGGRDGRAPGEEPLPVGFLADVLDRDTVQVRGEWAATPLAPRSAEGEVLVVHLASTPPSPPPLSQRERGVVSLPPSQRERGVLSLPCPRKRERGVLRRHSNNLRR